MTVKKDVLESSEFNVRDYLKLSFDLVNNKLSTIDEKATNTEASVQGVIRTINQMQIVHASQYASYPTRDELHSLDKKVDKEVQILTLKITEFELIKQYWKVFAISGAVTIVGMIFTGYLAFAKLERILPTTEKKENGVSKESIPTPDNSTTGSYLVH